MENSAPPLDFLGLQRRFSYICFFGFFWQIGVGKQDVGEVFCRVLYPIRLFVISSVSSDEVTRTIFGGAIYDVVQAKRTIGTSLFFG
jgi:hypothetical protein